MPTKKLTEKIHISKLRKRIEDSINQKEFLHQKTRTSLLDYFYKNFDSKRFLFDFPIVVC